MQNKAWNNSILMLSLRLLWRTWDIQTYYTKDTNIWERHNNKHPKTKIQKDKCIFPITIPPPPRKSTRSRWLFLSLQSWLLVGYEEPQGREDVTRHDITGSVAPWHPGKHKYNPDCYFLFSQSSSMSEEYLSQKCTLAFTSLHVQ